MKNLKVLAWDNGYDTENLMCGVDNKVRFPSTFYKPNRITDIEQDITDKSFTKDRMVLEYEGETFYLGDYAIKQDPEAGGRDYTIDRFKDRSEVAKFLAGTSLLADIGKEDTIDIDLLVLGLSIHSARRLEKEIVNFYKENQFKFKIEGKERRIITNDVIFVPQGLGAFYNKIMTFNGRMKKEAAKENNLLNSWYGLIDIGGNTVDCFVAEGLDTIDNSEIGMTRGLSDAYKAVIDNNEVPYNLVQKAYLNGEEELTYNSTKYNGLIDKCQTQFEVLAEEIHTELGDRWNRYLQRIDNLILTGGGAKAIGSYLKTLFEERNDKRVIMMEDPQFANCYGYYKLGIYRRRSGKDAEKEG